MTKDRDKLTETPAAGVSRRKRLRMNRAGGINRDRLSKRLRMSCSLMVSYVLLLSATIVPIRAQTGPQPGNNDPAGKPDRDNIFPSHDLMAFIPEGDTVQVTPDGFDHSLNQTPLSYQYDLDSRS